MLIRAMLALALVGLLSGRMPPPQAARLDTVRAEIAASRPAERLRSEIGRSWTLLHDGAGRPAEATPR